LALQPFRSDIISLRTIAKIMCRTIHFDREARDWAVEVEHIWAEGVLASEAHLGASQSNPE
jgi:hypothetical protein